MNAPREDRIVRPDALPVQAAQAQEGCRHGGKGAGRPGLQRLGERTAGGEKTLGPVKPHIEFRQAPQAEEAGRIEHILEQLGGLLV